MKPTAPDKKVNAQYRLPFRLVKRIRHEAAEQNVRPCVVAEQLIESGLERLADESRLPAAAAS